MMSGVCVVVRCSVLVVVVIVWLLSWCVRLVGFGVIMLMMCCVCVLFVDRFMVLCIVCLVYLILCLCNCVRLWMYVEVFWIVLWILVDCVLVGSMVVVFDMLDVFDVLVGCGVVGFVFGGVVLLMLNCMGDVVLRLVLGVIVVKWFV